MGVGYTEGGPLTTIKFGMIMQNTDPGLHYFVSLHNAAAVGGQHCLLQGTKHGKETLRSHGEAGWMAWLGSREG